MDYKNKEFIIKISCGRNGFGLDTEKGGTGLQMLAMSMRMNLSDDVLWVVRPKIRRCLTLSGSLENYLVRKSTTKGSTFMPECPEETRIS